MGRAIDLCRDHLRQVLTPAEFAELRIEPGRRHYKAYLPSRKVHFNIPQNPSDHRWFLNWKSQLRRALS